MASERVNDSGIEIKPVYGADALQGWDPAEQLGDPGKYPYTRGIYPSMRRDRPWTIRPYSGFGTAQSTNQRWKQLLAAGSTGLSCAFDLPTQMGYDSDHQRAEGEVGKVGVAIDSVEDMHALLDGLPLDEVSTSMTINATAGILLLLYQLVAEENGTAADKLNGTIQNDILKEYVARGTYIYPPRPSMRLITDIFAYCNGNLPRWNTISISGYHIREAGSTAVQEIAFTIANGIADVQAAIDAGLVVDTVDSLAGSYFVETLTDQVEQGAWEYLEKIDGMGGAVAAIEAGYMQDEIEQAAFEYAKSVDNGESVIVGVNQFVTDAVEPA